MMTLRRCLIAIALVALALPVSAGSANPSNADDPSKQPNLTASMKNTAQSSRVSSASSPNIGWKGWGVRLGLSDDVDQVLGGAHFNLGEVAKNFRIQPDVQLGTGDDSTTIFGTVPVYYRFDAGTAFIPYAGAGVSFGWVDDDRNNKHTEFEVGAKATGGLEWPQADGQAFFVELSVGFGGEVHDATVMAAWSF